jgi:hypothetical protein
LIQNDWDRLEHVRHLGRFPVRYVAEHVPVEMPCGATAQILKIALAVATPQKGDGVDATKTDACDLSSRRRAPDDW